MADNQAESPNPDQPEMPQPAASTPIDTSAQASQPDTEPTQKPKDEFLTNRDLLTHEGQFVSSFFGRLLATPKNYEFSDSEKLTAEQKKSKTEELQKLSDKLLKHEQLTGEDLAILEQVNLFFTKSRDVIAGFSDEEMVQFSANMVQQAASMRTLLNFYCIPEQSVWLSDTKKDTVLSVDTRREIIEAASNFGLLTADQNPAQAITQVFTKLTDNLIDPEFMTPSLQKLQMALQGRLIITPEDFKALSIEVKTEIQKILQEHPQSKRQAKKENTTSKGDYQQELQATIGRLEQQFDTVSDVNMRQSLYREISVLQSTLTILEHSGLAQAISSTMLDKIGQIYEELPVKETKSLESWFNLFGNEPNQSDVEALVELLGLSSMVESQLKKEDFAKLKEKGWKIGKGAFWVTLLFLVLQIYTNLGAEGNQGGGH